MKTLIIILLLTALAASDLFCQLKGSGWNDSITFKEQKYIIPPISKIKFSADSKRFITYSGDTTVRIWDIETGNLLSEYKLNFSIIADVDLNENEKWVAVAITTPNGDYSRVKSEIYDYINDSIIQEYHLNKEDYNPLNAWSSQIFNNLILFLNNRDIILNNFSMHADAGGATYDSGFIYELSPDSNKIIWKSGTGSFSNYFPLKILKWKKSKQFNKVFYYSYYSYFYSPSHGGQSGTGYGSYLIDMDSLKSKNFPTTDMFDFSFDDDYIAYKDNSKNTVNFYNLTNSKIESLINYNNNNPENKLNDIAFGYKNYDLYFSTTNKLYHWSHWTGTIVDSFNLSGANGEAWQLSCSKDGKYMLAASNQGHIRIYDMGKVMSVEDKDVTDTQFDDFIVTPVPASQTLNVRYQVPEIKDQISDNREQIIIECPVKLSLFNLLGQEAAVLVDDFQSGGWYNSQFSIVNSQLSAGVYLLKFKACGINRTKKVVILK